MDNKSLNAYAAKLIEERKSLFCIYGFSQFEPKIEYKEIDGTTGKVMRSGVVQSLTEKNLVVKDWTKYGDNIYFTALKDEKFPTHIGVLNYDTLELLHWQKVDLQVGCYLPAGKAPVVNENNLYVLNTAGTLHIFEKE